MKIVYFGFDLFADCLEVLADMPGVEIMALYTFNTDNVFEFNTRVIEIAKAKNIPVHTEKITAAALEEYFNAGCFTTVSAGYIYKIPVLKRADFKGVNIHPALLPIGRGAWPFPVTILKGLKTSGVTIHKITDKFDEGDILIQQDFAVSSTETLESLTEKSVNIAVGLIEKCINNFKDLWENAVPQTGGEYWQEPGDFERTITPDMTTAQAEKTVRAFGGYGVIYNGKEYRGNGEDGVRVTLCDGEILLK